MIFGLVCTTEALEFNDSENENEQIKRISSFGESGLLTSNKGIIIKMNDGSEFQITIVHELWSVDEKRNMIEILDIKSKRKYLKII